MSASINGSEVTSEQIPPPIFKKWYAAYTKPSHEKRVAEHLETRGVEKFLPLFQSRRHWKNGCQVTLNRPLFPSYVFVRIAPADRIRVLDVSSVLSIVGDGRGPIPLPDDDVERLKEGLRLSILEPHPFLNVGAKVRVCQGPLQGMVGRIVKTKGKLRVVVNLDLIMKSVAVDVAADDLEPVPENTSVRRSEA